MLYLARGDVGCMRLLLLEVGFHLVLVKWGREKILPRGLGEG